MADIKISQLPAAGTLDGTELVPIVQTGTTVKTTAQDIADLSAGGGGTVTAVSVTTANGISGSVANPTTTPAISLTLGAITPTTVNASGAVTGSNLSGTNTGDQTITLTGQVTGSGTGSFATTIANNTVTNAELAQMATHTVKGNATGGTANAADLTGTQVTALLDSFTSSLQGVVPPSGGGTTAFLRADGTFAVPPGGGGSGTVTSVALTAPAEFSVAGSPITTSGTLAITKATQSANNIWAGPTTGAAAVPAFRALVAADIGSGIVNLTTAVSGVLPVLNGGTGVTTSTGSGNNVLSTSPTLVTPALGTPSAAVLTNATGLPISSGVSGLGTGVATFLATPSSANLAAALTDETGSGAAVFATSPILVTPALGTPASGVLTNTTGLPISTGVSGLGAGIATFLATPSSANLAAALTDETGSGAAVFATSPTLVTPALGTPSAAILTNATGLPIASGVSGLGTGVATFLATPTSANLAAALTDETGTGANVFATSPTLVTPLLGTPTSGVMTNVTGLPLSTGVTGTLPVLNGGTGVTTSTGTGSVVLSTSPTLVTPALGTPSAAVLTNATGLPIASGVSGLGTGVATFLATPSSANLAAALTDETGTGSAVFATSPTLVTPILGTPTSGTLTNTTGLPISTGVSGLGTGVATFLATPTSANLAAALTDETGTGANVFATSPTLVTPLLGTPTSGVMTNVTGLPLTSGVTGTLPVANGGTNQTSYTDGQLLIGNTSTTSLTKSTITAGSGISVTNGNGSITIATTGGGSGTVTSVDMTVPAEFSVSGNPITTSGTLAVTKATQTANTVWAGPASGSAAVPTFRALTTADITGASTVDYGNGSDGAVTISVNTTLSRTQMYTNLTVNAATTLTTAGMKIFCSGTLLNNGTISWNGGNGGNASGATGGSAGTALTTADLGGSGGGGAGTTGLTSVGVGGGVAGNGGNGGSGNAGATGGTGASGAAGASGGGGSAALRPTFFLTQHLLAGNTIVLGGGGARGSGSGSGDGVTNVGGGGGGSGSGGGVILIWAQTLNNAGSITANGGNGGTGGSVASGNVGGGAGGSSGGGGYVFLVYDILTALGTVQANAGSIGTGGTGNGGGTSGANGNAGSAGRVVKYNGSTRVWS